MKNLRDYYDLPFLFAMIALSMEDRHCLALSGTFEAVFTASTQDRHAASILSTLIWRVFSGLSHLQETRMVGRAEFTSPSYKVSISI